MSQRRGIFAIYLSIRFFSLVSSIFINPIDLRKVLLVSFNSKFSSFSLLSEFSYMSPILIVNISTNLELWSIKYKVRLSLWILNTADLSFTSSISFSGLVSNNKKIKVVSKKLHLVIVIANHQLILKLLQLRLLIFLLLELLLQRQFESLFSSKLRILFKLFFLFLN